MLSLDWALVCDFAYFDRADRLCMIGVEPSGLPRILPIGVHHLAIAVHVSGRDPDDDPDVALFITAPNGEWRAVDAITGFNVECRGEFLLVQMPSLPFQEEGLYHFELACGAQQSFGEMSVCVRSNSRPARIHLHGAH